MAESENQIIKREPNNKERLAEKLDRNLRRGFIDCFLNFLSGLGQPVGIDINPYPTAGTGHVLVRLEQ